MRISWDGPIQILVQSQAHSVSWLSMSHSCMVTFSAVSWQPELMKESKKFLHPESSIVSQGLCQQPHGRWAMESRLGAGIAHPRFQAWEARAVAARGTKIIWGSLLHPSMLSKWNLVKMRSLDHQSSRRNGGPSRTIWSLRRASVESGRWRPAPLP